MNLSTKISCFVVFQFVLLSNGYTQVLAPVIENQIACLEALKEFNPDQETILDQDELYFFTTWNKPGEVDKDDYDNHLRILVVYDSVTKTSFYVELRNPQKKKFGYSIYLGTFVHPFTGEYFEYEVSYSFLLDGPGRIEKLSSRSFESDTNLSRTGESELLSLRFLEKLNWIMRRLRHETRQETPNFTKDDLKASEIPKTCRGVGRKKFRFL